MFSQQLINALSLGSVYALFALGFTLIFGVLGVINLAHGAVFMMGSYLALLLVEQFSLPIFPAFLLAMLASGVIAVVIDFLVLRPLRARNAPHLAPMIATIGVAILVTNLMQGRMGAEVKRFPTGILPEDSLSFGDLHVTELQIGIMGHDEKNPVRQIITCNCRVP